MAGSERFTRVFFRNRCSSSIIAYLSFNSTSRTTRQVRVGVFFENYKLVQWTLNNRIVISLHKINEYLSYWYWIDMTRSIKIQPPFPKQQLIGKRTYVYASARLGQTCLETLFCSCKSHGIYNFTPINVNEVSFWKFTTFTLVCIRTQQRIV